MEQHSIVIFRWGGKRTLSDYYLMNVSLVNCCRSADDCLRVQTRSYFFEGRLLLFLSSDLLEDRFFMITIFSRKIIPIISDLKGKYRWHKLCETSSGLVHLTDDADEAAGFIH